VNLGVISHNTYSTVVPPELVVPAPFAPHRVMRLLFGSYNPFVFFTTNVLYRHMYLQPSHAFVLPADGPARSRPPTLQAVGSQGRCQDNHVKPPKFEDEEEAQGEEEQEEPEQVKEKTLTKEA